MKGNIGGYFKAPKGLTQPKIPALHLRQVQSLVNLGFLFGVRGKRGNKSQKRFFEDLDEYKTYEISARVVSKQFCGKISATCQKSEVFVVISEVYVVKSEANGATYGEVML